MLRKSMQGTGEQKGQELGAVKRQRKTLHHCAARHSRYIIKLHSFFRGVINGLQMILYPIYDSVLSIHYLLCINCCIYADELNVIVNSAAG